MAASPDLLAPGRDVARLPFSLWVYALAQLSLAVSMPSSLTDAIQDANTQHLVLELEVAGTSRVWDTD